MSVTDVCELFRNTQMRIGCRCEPDDSVARVAVMPCPVPAIVRSQPKSAPAKPG